MNIHRRVREDLRIGGIGEGQYQRLQGISADDLD